MTDNFEAFLDSFPELTEDELFNNDDAEVVAEPKERKANGHK